MNCRKAIFGTLALAAALAVGNGCQKVSDVSGVEESTGHTVTINPHSSTLEAGGSTPVSIGVQKVSGAAVDDGMEILLNAEKGTVTPPIAHTVAGEALVHYSAPDEGGTDTIQAVVGSVKAEAEVTVTAPPAAEPEEEQAEEPEEEQAEEPASADEIDLSDVTFLHTSVAKWNQTSTVKSVTIDGRMICIDHTKKGQWPIASGVEGNPWVVAKVGGKWYAATYEWLRSGQVCKQINAETIGPHIKVGPLNSWRPRSGEKVGFMVSTHARAGVQTIKERSNVVMTTWP